MQSSDASMIDIRQAQGWQKYLEILGCKCIRTASEILVALVQLPFCAAAKIQRPKVFTATDLEEVEYICKQNNALLVKLEPSVDQNLSVLETSGWEKNRSPFLPPSTIFIDLKKSEKELWNNLASNAKYSIKAANKEDLRIEIIKNPGQDYLRDFYKISKETGKHKRFYIQGFEDLTAKALAFGDETYLHFVFDKSDNIISGNFYMGFDSNVWYIHGAMTTKNRRSNAGHKLMWESILHFKKLGYTILDLEGKDDARFPAFTKNWGGFSFFKEKFGGKVVEFPQPYIKIYNPLLKIMTKIAGDTIAI